MAFNQNQHQNQVLDQRQEQTMSHQQIRALEMLAAPVIELRQIINQEIQQNPVIETEEDATEPLFSEEEKDDSHNDEERWVEQLIKSEYSSQYRDDLPASSSKETEEKRAHYFNSITEKPTLHAQLEDQLRFMELDDELAETCQLVVDGLDDNGYLKSHPADIAMAMGLPLDKVENAVNAVQSLDPAGVAAKDLRERLLLQLERRGKQTSLAYRAVSECSDDLANNRLSQMAKKLGVNISDLKNIFEELKLLNPCLSQAPQTDPAKYVKEEITVEKNENELTVSTKDDHLPKLSISNYYQQLLEESDLGKESRKYIKDKIKSAGSLIDNLAQRQRTMESIANCLVNAQRDFFLHGPENLKPLTMATVAEKVGVHETTVSRCVAGKYLRCPYGLFPLKHFFSTGYKTSHGQTVSKKVVSDRIRELVKKENPAKPFSDTRLASELKKQGINVARRTVAKYREQMKILPSSQRRRYW